MQKLGRIVVSLTLALCLLLDPCRAYAFAGPAVASSHALDREIVQREALSAGALFYWLGSLSQRSLRDTCALVRVPSPIEHTWSPERLRKLIGAANAALAKARATWTAKITTHAAQAVISAAEGQLKILAGWGGAIEKASVALWISRDESPAALASYNKGTGEISYVDSLGESIKVLVIAAVTEFDGAKSRQMAESFKQDLPRMIEQDSRYHDLIEAVLRADPPPGLRVFAESDLFWTVENRARAVRIRITDPFDYACHLIAQFLDDEGREQAFGGLLLDADEHQQGLGKILFDKFISRPAGHPLNRVRAMRDPDSADGDRTRQLDYLQTWLQRITLLNQPVDYRVDDPDWWNFLAGGLVGHPGWKIYLHKVWPHPGQPVRLASLNPQTFEPDWKEDPLKALAMILVVKQANTKLDEQAFMKAVQVALTRIRHNIHFNLLVRKLSSIPDLREAFSDLQEVPLDDQVDRTALISKMQHALLDIRAGKPVAPEPQKKVPQETEIDRQLRLAGDQIGELKSRVRTRSVQKALVDAESSLKTFAVTRDVGTAKAAYQAIKAVLQVASDGAQMAAISRADWQNVGKLKWVPGAIERWIEQQKAGDRPVLQPAIPIGSAAVPVAAPPAAVLAAAPAPPPPVAFVPHSPQPAAEASAPAAKTVRVPFDVTFAVVKSVREGARKLISILDELERSASWGERLAAYQALHETVRALNDLTPNQPDSWRPAIENAQAQIGTLSKMTSVFTTKDQKILQKATEALDNALAAGSVKTELTQSMSRHEPSRPAAPREAQRLSNWHEIPGDVQDRIQELSEGTYQEQRKGILAQAYLFEIPFGQAADLHESCGWSKSEAENTLSELIARQIPGDLSESERLKLAPLASKIIHTIMTPPQKRAAPGVSEILFRIARHAGDLSKASNADQKLRDTLKWLITKDLRSWGIRGRSLDALAEEYAEELADLFVAPEIIGHLEGAGLGEGASPAPVTTGAATDVAFEEGGVLEVPIYAGTVSQLLKMALEVDEIQRRDHLVAWINRTFQYNEWRDDDYFTVSLRRLDGVPIDNPPDLDSPLGSGAVMQFQIRSWAAGVPISVLRHIHAITLNSNCICALCQAYRLERILSSVSNSLRLYGFGVGGDEAYVAANLIMARRFPVENLSEPVRMDLAEVLSDAIERLTNNTSVNRQRVVDIMAALAWGDRSFFPDTSDPSLARSAVVALMDASLPDTVALNIAQRTIKAAEPAQPPALPAAPSGSASGGIPEGMRKHIKSTIDTLEGPISSGNEFASKAISALSQFLSGPTVANLTSAIASCREAGNAAVGDEIAWASLHNLGEDLRELLSRMQAEAASQAGAAAPPAQTDVSNAGAEPRLVPGLRDLPTGAVRQILTLSPDQDHQIALAQAFQLHVTLEQAVSSLHYYKFSGNAEEAVRRIIAMRLPEDRLSENDREKLAPLLAEAGSYVWVRRGTALGCGEKDPAIRALVGYALRDIKMLGVEEDSHIPGRVIALLKEAGLEFNLAAFPDMLYKLFPEAARPPAASSAYLETLKVALTKWQSYLWLSDDEMRDLADIIGSLMADVPNSVHSAHEEWVWAKLAAVAGLNLYALGASVFSGVREAAIRRLIDVDIDQIMAANMVDRVLARFPLPETQSQRIAAVRLTELSRWRSAPEHFPRQALEGYDRALDSLWRYVRDGNMQSLAEAVSGLVEIMNKWGTEMMGGLDGIIEDALKPLRPLIPDQSPADPRPKGRPLQQAG